MLQVDFEQNSLFTQWGKQYRTRHVRSHRSCETQDSFSPPCGETSVTLKPCPAHQKYLSKRPPSNNKALSSPGIQRTKLFRACTIWTQALTLAAADTGHKRPRLQDSTRGPVFTSTLPFIAHAYASGASTGSSITTGHQGQQSHTPGRAEVFKMRLSTIDRRTSHRHTMKPVTRSQRRPHPPLQDVLRERREGNRKSGAHDSGALSSGSSNNPSRNCLLPNPTSTHSSCAPREGNVGCSMRKELCPGLPAPGSILITG